ncbi:MAG: hypothetical protein ACFFCQ_08445 [Promethearchaeota archaeon]
MTYLSVLETPKLDRNLWIQWIFASLIGWSVLACLILLIDNIFLVFPVILVGSTTVGIIQWFTIRQTFSWAKWWVLISILGMALGIVLISLMFVSALVFGLFGGFIGMTLFGALGGAIFPAIGASFSYVLIYYTLWNKVVAMSSSVKKTKAIVLEGAIAVGVTIAAVVPLGYIFVLLNNTLFGVFISGIIFGRITGSQLSDIGWTSEYS